MRVNLMNDSKSEKPSALSFSRLGALTGRWSMSASPYAAAPPLGSTLPLVAALRKLEADRIRRLAAKSHYPPPS